MIEALVAAGHPLPRVMEYTMPQLVYFSDLLGKRQKQDYRLLAIVVRTAHHADAKDFKKLLRELERE